MNTTTFTQIVSQATVTDGSLKKSLDVTRMAGDDSLAVEFNGDNLVINGSLVSPLVAAAAALLPAYQNDSRQSLADRVAMLSAGYINQLQQTVATKLLEAPATKKSNPLHSAKKGLTSSEYKANCLHLGRDNFDAVAVEHLFSIDLAKATKADLVAYITELRESIYSSEQQEVYSNMLEAEEKTAKQFEGLTSAGFENVTRVGETLIKASLPASIAATALPKLAELGYALTWSNMDVKTFVLDVQFKEGVAEQIV